MGRDFLINSTFTVLVMNSGTLSLKVTFVNA